MTSEVVAQRPSLRVKPGDFAANWSTFAEAVKSILLHPREPSPTPLTSLYHRVYRMCSSPCANMQKPESLRGEPEKGGAAHNQYRYVYFHLVDILEQHVKSRGAMVKGHEVALLRSYVSVYDDYALALRKLCFIFGYLNKEWVVKNKGQPGVTEIWVLGITRWREMVFYPMRENLIRSVLNQISQDRDSIPIDKPLLRRVLTSLVELKIDPKRPTGCYSTQFETAFILYTEKYYTHEVNKLTAPECPVEEYMIRAERRIREEAKRVDEYLDKSTAQPLKRVVVKVMVELRLPELLKQVVTWIENGCHDHLARLYWLLSQSEMGLEPLRKVVEDHIDEEGRAQVEKNANEMLKSPSLFVETVHKVYSTYSDLVRDVFGNHDQLKLALEEGGRRFINKNALCMQSSSRGAELLAKHLNIVMKPGSHTFSDNDVENQLNNAMQIFGLLTDRDIFIKIYSSLMSGRLIHHTYNADVETAMIGKLKERCGHEPTYKLQRMFNDAETFSKGVAQGFEDAHPQHSDFHAMVLTHGSWPIIPAAPLPFPVEMEQKYVLFERFFNERHDGRKLQWIPQNTYGTVKTNFPLPRERSYELVVSASQALLLSVFNTKGHESDPVRTVTMAELAEAVQDEKVAAAALTPFLRHRLLLAEGAGVAQSFTINTQFSNSLRKIQMNAALLREGANVSTDEAVVQVKTEDRKYVIQAAVVRVMKSRQVLAHQQLIAETVALLKDRFSPKVADIKSNIETLIDKEYLERVEGDTSTFRYVS